jgi:hypothetical protein
MSWVARLTTISLEMVLPGLLGYWLDQWLGTGYWLAMGGFALGFVVAFIHLLQIASADQPPSTARRKDAGDDPPSSAS